MFRLCLTAFLLSTFVSALSAQVTIYSQDRAGFDLAAGSPPVSLDFETLNSGDNVEGLNIQGIQLSGGGSTLYVEKGIDTYTPPGFGGLIDPETNKLFPTSGDLVLSPGGLELGPGPDPVLEDDQFLVTFDDPISAFGFDHLSQSADGVSFTYVTVWDPAGIVLYSGNLPITNLGGGGAPGGADFWGIVSATADIKTVLVADVDSDTLFPDCNIGLDSFRYYHDTLGVTIEPPVVSPGQNMTVGAYGGVPSQPMILFVIDVNGSPMFQPVVTSAFGADGNWLLPTTAPSLSGTSITLQAVGYARSGTPVLSTPGTFMIQ